MDWIRQETMKNWLILGLVILNSVTLSIIWMLAPTGSGQPVQEQAGRQPESVRLLKNVLDLDARQVASADSIMTARREQSKEANDRASRLKRQLAEQIFKDPPDTALARTLAGEIGALQTEIELVRFRHFLALVGICTPDQRARLKPVVIEAFGRKPPREEPGGLRGDQERRPEPREYERPQKQAAEPAHGQREPPPERPREAPADRPPQVGHPSVEEKLDRYAERLNLSEQQIRQVRAILQEFREKGEASRRSGSERELSREALKKQEDERILQILDADQKKEFDRMISRRQDRPR